LIIPRDAAGFQNIKVLTGGSKPALMAYACRRSGARLLTADSLGEREVVKERLTNGSSGRRGGRVHRVAKKGGDD
jgi:hypothetical protein